MIETALSGSVIYAWPLKHLQLHELKILIFYDALFFAKQNKT